MLPERRGTHVRAVRQFVPVESLHEVLLEPGDGEPDDHQRARDRERCANTSALVGTCRSTIHSHASDAAM